LIKMQHPLFTLFEHINRPFVQHLIALMVSGLIALLLGGALLLSEHSAFITHLSQLPLSTVKCIAVHANPPVAADNTSVW
jgi:hypothetical protein